MTLIAFAAHGDHAEIVVDTAGYTQGARTFLLSTKIDVLTHMDAIVATQGDHQLGLIVRTGFAVANRGDFDETIESAPAHLREAWGNCKASSMPHGEASVFLIGYSVAGEEFRAFRFLAEHDFEAERVEGLHVMPTPFGARLPAYERERIARAFPGDKGAILDEWEAMPDYPMPQDLLDWAVLGKVARKTRALGDKPGKVMVAGKLIHCRLERGYAAIQTLLDFDDSGDELDELVRGTLHPRAQLAPCWCDSGKIAIDCCMVQRDGQECPCGYGDGKTFIECCMVTGEERDAQLAEGSLL